MSADLKLALDIANRIAKDGGGGMGSSGGPTGNSGSVGGSPMVADDVYTETAGSGTRRKVNRNSSPYTVREAETRGGGTGMG